MKITSCYISSFGKFKDFSFNFNDGLNTILADNGWGKSTLAYFIKSMFYGLSGTNKRSVLENERQRFKPWNSIEKFGGSLEFEYKDRHFKIERFFGNKESEDTLKLFDLDSGREVNSENLGARIFQLDEEGFLSTAYLTQRDFEGVSSASITAKFNESAKPEDTEQFKGAISRLEDKIKSFKAQRGSGGIINNIENEIAENAKNLESAQSATPYFEHFKAETERLAKEKESLAKEIDYIKKELDDNSKREIINLKRKNFSELTLEKESFAKEREQLNVILKGKRLDDESINLTSKGANELVKKIERRNALKEFIGVENVKKEQKSFNPFYLLLIISIVLACTSVALFALKNYLVGALILVFSAVFFVLCFSLKNKKPKEKPSDTISSNKLDNLNAEIYEIESVLSSFLSNYNAYGNDYLQKINSLILAENEMRKLDIKEQELNAKLERYKNDLDLNANFSALPCKFTQQDLDVKRLQFDRVCESLIIAQNKLEKFDNLLSEIPEYLSQDLRLKEMLKEAKQKHKTCERALKFLKEADENFKTKYRAPLKESFNKFISLIENSSEFSADIDVDFKVSVQNKGALYSKDFYSEGYKDLLEIAKRFALIDVFFKDEKPFVILDDPFCNLDKTKTEKALELIEKLSEKFQIIYFICHASRGEKSAE